MSSRQKSFVDKFSQLVIRESSDFGGATSSDAELSDWGKEEMQFAAQMTSSKLRDDSRFINLYKLREAEHQNLAVITPEAPPIQNRVEPC